MIHEQEYIQLLRRELVPALGCTEPIALAYGAARCRALLGNMPERMTLYCSGNIIKNTKSVVVPATDGLRGIEIAALLGTVAGKAELGMEVLRDIVPSDVDKAKALRQEGVCEVELLPGEENLHFIVEMWKGNASALVEIAHTHLNVIREEKNGQLLHMGKSAGSGAASGQECGFSMDSIYHFAREVSLEAIRPILRNQMDTNLRIAERGLSEGSGAAVGQTVLNSGLPLARAKAIAYAAAGSDARMSGCILPVVINSGSGNQGMTVSLPVAVYAKETGTEEETLLRALAFSNLLAIYQKSYVGKLSAFCGVVSAATGAVAGIAFLCGEPLAVIKGAVINTLANISGMVCDGAKASCAAKIATALQAGFIAYDMARSGHVFQNGDGLVKSTADETIAAVGRMGREGMRATDQEILKIMLEP